MGEGSEGVALTVAGIRAADFKSDGDDIVVDVLEARLEPHAGFPDKMGWQMFRDGEVVPSSEKALKGRQSRFMFRNEEPFVGPACRGISNKGSGWNVIFLYLKPSFEGGAVVEIPWSGAFQSIANRLIRLYAARVGIDASFSVLDRGDAADLMDLIRHELGLSKTEKRFPRKDTCLAIYSHRVNTQRPLAESLASAFPWCAEWEEELIRLYRAYVEKKLVHQSQHT